MAGGRSGTLTETLQRYLQPTQREKSELDQAKLEFSKLQDYLSENLKTKKRNKAKLPYSSVDATSYLGKAVQLQDATFDLLVKVKEDDVVPNEKGTSGYKFELDGLSKDLQYYSANVGILMTRIGADITAALNKFVKNNHEFDRRISMAVNKFKCQIFVARSSGCEVKKGGPVPTISARSMKEASLPFFTIHLKCVFVCGSRQFTLIPGSSPPAWMEYREDAMHHRDVRVLLQALLYSAPFINEYSASDLAASAVTAVQGTGLEDHLLCALDELEKGCRSGNLAHPTCPNVSLLAEPLQKVGKRKRNRNNKLSVFLSQLMQRHCQLVKEIIEVYEGQEDETEE